MDLKTYAMTPDEYLINILRAKKANPVSLSDWRLNNIKSIITTWAGQQLSGLKPAGSNAKGTSVKGMADFDILISLKSDTTETLKEIYNKLDSKVTEQGIKTRRQDVSLGITQNGINIDLVPGKIQSGYQNYHSIYSSKKDTWIQTNIDLHISKVVNSKRTNEIILIKIWRHIHKIDLPSVYLELTVLNALYNKSVNNLADNFWTILTYLRDNFINSSVTDPANTNNIISDMLHKYEKETISAKAKESLSKQNWGEIIW